MKYLAMFFVGALMLLSCSKDNLTNDEPEQIDAEVYEVYRTLLMPLSSIQLLLNETDTLLNCRYFNAIDFDSVGITQADIEKCIVKNHRSYTFNEKDFALGVHPMISTEELEDLGLEGALEKYHAVSLLSFGYPYFYDNGNKVMFERSYICGPLCGSGEIIVMEKENGYWQQVYSQLTWISK